MTDIEVFNPATGEILEHLDQQPPDALAEALHEVHRRQEQLKTAQAALEQELRRRLKIRKARLVVFGDWEVEAGKRREREWDADELRAVLENLKEEGVIRASDTADVFIQPAAYVSKAQANKLADRLTGDAKTAVEACFTWKEKPGKLTVARSVNLLDAVPAAAEKTPPVDGTTSRDGTVPDRGAPAGVSERAGSSESPGAARASSPPHTPAQEARGAPEARPAQPAELDPERLFA